MVLELQFKIKNNPNYLRYLHEHSNWYKELNRNPNAFPAFEERVKEEYRLRPSDKLEQMINTIDMLQTVISTLK